MKPEIVCKFVYNCATDGILCEWVWWRWSLSHLLSPGSVSRWRRQHHKDNDKHCFVCSNSRAPCPRVSQCLNVVAIMWLLTRWRGPGDGRLSRSCVTCQYIYYNPILSLTISSSPPRTCFSILNCLIVNGTNPSSSLWLPILGDTL